MVNPQAAKRFRLLTKGAKIPELQAFIEEFDMSSWGARARLLLGDHLFEEGRLDDALRAWEPLLERENVTASLVKRIGFAYHRRGRLNDLRRLITKNLPGASALTALAQRRAPPPDPKRPFTSLAKLKVKRRWVYELSERSWRLNLDEGSGRTVHRDPWEQEDRSFKPLFPLMIDGVLFFNGGQEQIPQPEKEAVLIGKSYPLFALHLRTARFVAAPAMIPRIHYYPPWTLKEPVGEPRLDLTRDENLLVLARWVPGKPPDGPPGWRVAALDLGKFQSLGTPPPVLWEWDPGSLDRTVGPAPAVDGNRVFVTFFETMERDILHFVACLDAKSGRELWRTFVSAIPHGGRQEMMGFRDAVAQPSPPLVRGGKVFLATNMGILSALDVATGGLCWVLKYARVLPRKREAPWIWFSNPLLFHEGTLVAAPKSYPYLIAVDPASGRPLWSYWDKFDKTWDQFQHFINTRLRDEEQNLDFDTRYRHLLGVRKGILVYTSETQVHAARINDGGLVWFYELGTRITGKGCFLGDLLFVPTATGVVVLDILKGRRVGKEGPEHLLCWADYIKPRTGFQTELGEDFRGGNLFVVQLPRIWCTHPPKENAPVCLGRISPGGGKGGGVCTVCGREYAPDEVLYLVAVDKQYIICFTILPSEEGEREEKK
jgi:hypothetical protein